MEELRFVRREEQSLVVATETGDELRLVVDETILSELRQLSRRQRDTSKVRPREIQQHIRAGKSRAEVAELTGLDEEDIERYEEPVLAERRYILELAHAVPVRTNASEEEPQEFGAVIDERLHGLGAHDATWSSWRDEEIGWMISLDFSSHDVSHHAIWSFDHRKSVLSPTNSDAVTLSKQGDVGERLIPKLRAVDNGAGSARFEPEAFDADGDAPSDDVRLADAQAQPTDVAHEVADSTDQEAEYVRQREIDQRAISTTSNDPADLGQTADLLDALRRRRGEREQAQQPLAQQAVAEDGTAEQASDVEDDTIEQRSPGRHLAHLPGDADDAASPETSVQLDLPEEQGAGDRSSNDAVTSTAQPENVGSVAPTDQENPERSRGTGESTSEGSRRKRRASIPSWDDILFGTRSEEDPS